MLENRLGKEPEMLLFIDLTERFDIACHGYVQQEET